MVFSVHCIRIYRLFNPPLILEWHRYARELVLYEGADLIHPTIFRG